MKDKIIEIGKKYSWYSAPHQKYVIDEDALDVIATRVEQLLSEPEAMVKK